MEELVHFPPRSDVRALLAKFDPSSFDSERDAYDLTMAPNEHGFCLDSLPEWTGTKAEPTRTALCESCRSNTALCQLFIAHARRDHFSLGRWMRAQRSGRHHLDVLQRGAGGSVRFAGVG